MKPRVDTGDSRVGTRSLLKQALFAAVPDPIATKTLQLWRRCYWWHKQRIRPRTNRRIARTIVERGGPIKLELGSAKRPGMEDWVASDIGGGGDLQLDLTHPIPFPDNSVARIYSSHLLEHFSYPRPMLDLLNECQRILEPAGRLSVAVPNSRLFLEAYTHGQDLEGQRYCSYDVGLTYKSKIDYVNYIAYMGGEHRHMFDEENLLFILEEAGFRHVRLREFDPTIDLEIRRHESIYAEAVK